MLAQQAFDDSDKAKEKKNRWVEENVANKQAADEPNGCQSHHADAAQNGRVEESAFVEGVFLV